MTTSKKVFKLAVFLSLVLISLAASWCPSNAAKVFASTDNSQDYTYLVSGYVLNYSIVKMPPPQPGAIHPYAYNIIAYGPPPFPIQISFNEINEQGATEKMTVTMPTNAYSTSIGCTSYPTDITMTRADTNASPSSSITSLPTPSSPTSSPYLTPTLTPILTEPSESTPASSTATPTTSLTPTNPLQSQSTSPSTALSASPAQASEAQPLSTPNAESNSSANNYSENPTAILIIIFAAAAIIATVSILVLRSKKSSLQDSKP